MAVVDLTDFESRLLKWISASDFVEVAWSTKRAAEAFKVEEKDLDAVTGLCAPPPRVTSSRDHLV